MGADKAAPEARQPACTRCALSKDAATPCMPAKGEPGGLLVLGGSPAAGDDQGGEPFSTEVGRSLRRLVERWWDGPASYAYGVSCRGGREIPEAAFESCSPYLAGELDAGGYQRVLLVGADAARAAFGARLAPTLVRRAWGYVRGSCCFLVPHPLQAQHNRFIRRQLEEDLQWALKVPLPSPPEGDVRVLWEPAEAVAYLAALQPGVPVSLDIENVGHTFKASWRLLCVGMCERDGLAHVLPDAVLAEPAVRRAFAAFLADPAIPKGGHFLKYDINGLYREFGVEVRGFEYDTGIMHKLLESDSPAKLGVLAWKVGYGGYKKFTEAQMGEDDDKSEAYGKLEPNVLHAYNGRDVVVTHRVHALLSKPGRFDPHVPVWRRLVRPAIMALAQVERWGALLSEQRVREYDAWLGARYDSLDARLRATPEVPPVFNPSSNQQVSKLLFDTLGLSTKVLTKGGKKGVPKPSTSKKALEPLKEKHPLVGIILELQQVAKQRSTYGLPMLKHVGIDGRVHTTYNVIRSGRLSSNDPNLQNLTGKGEAGQRTRACWVAAPGHVLVSIDYSQIELRVLADLSGDEAMCEAFRKGGDFHTETGVLMAKLQLGKSREEFLAAYGNGTDGEKWAIDLRKGAKIVNFSLVFGKGDKGLAEELRTTVDKAKEMRALVLGAFPKMAAYQSRLVADAQVNGEVWTDWAGCRRRRALWSIGEDASSDAAPDRDPRNIAKNHPIQGTASEYTLASLVEIVQQQQDGDLPGRLILAIHDELVSEVPEARVRDYASAAKAIMLSWPTRMVPLKVDCEVGPDLGNLRKLEQ